MDRIDHVRTFIAVAERLSFAAAAHAQGLSPAAASRAVMALEKELGVSLLRRSTRAVSLTTEGAEYLERSRRALAELDEAARALQGEGGEPTGQLVVSAPVAMGRLHVAPVVARLIAAHPALSVRLILADRIVRVVDEGIDVAVRIAELPDSALHAVRIHALRRVLVASPAYLSAHGTPADIESLAAHDLISFEGMETPDWRFAGRTLRVSPRLLVNSAEAAIAAAVAGAGIAHGLCYQADAEVAAGRLVYLLPEQDPPGTPVHVVFPANRGRAPSVRAFIDAMRDHFVKAQEICRS